MKEHTEHLDAKIIFFSLPQYFKYFFHDFRIFSYIHDSNFSKLFGYSINYIFISILLLPFEGLNIFKKFYSNDKSKITDKTAIYRFLNNPKHGWRNLLLNSARSFYDYIVHVDSLSEHCNKIKTAFVFDDTCIYRNSSRKVELLGNLYDHSKQKYYKGFKQLTLLYTDTLSPFVVDFALKTNSNTDLIVYNETKDLDKRTSGAIRRAEATTPSPDLLVPMLKRAIKKGISADYILMDSWFATKPIISKLSKIKPVVMMLKNNKTIYKHGSKYVTLDGLHVNLNKKNCHVYDNKFIILCTRKVQIEIPDENNPETLKETIDAKIVFTSTKKGNTWKAILSTDMKLSSKEILKVYAMRWDIECFYQTAKQFLGLENQCQSRDFDAMIASSSLVALRHMLLSYIKKRTQDPRSLPTLFSKFFDDVRGFAIEEALARVFSMAIEAGMRLSQSHRREDRKFAAGMLHELDCLLVVVYSLARTSACMTPDAQLLIERIKKLKTLQLQIVA